MNNQHFEHKNHQLQAQIFFQPGACNAYSIDFTIGCPHNCIYCYFSEFQKVMHKRKNRDFDGRIISMAVSEFLSKEAFPPQIYLSYSTDPFSQAAKEAAHQVLEHLLPRGIHFLILTKGVIPEDTIKLLHQYGDHVAIEIGISNLSKERNRLIEPGAASAEKRLALLAQLKQTNIAVLAARMDPIFPYLDDGDADVELLVNEIAKTGTKNIVVSYVVASQNMIKKMSRVEKLKLSLALLTEETPTVAPGLVYSVPFEYKKNKLIQIRNFCENKGLKMNLCSCKDFRLASIFTNNSCHPRDTANFIGKYTPPGNLVNISE